MHDEKFHKNFEIFQDTFWNISWNFLILSDLKLLKTWLKYIKLVGDT